MMDIYGLPPVKIEIDPGFTASMQEQIARRDHRIAVLEAICDAQKARLARLQARDGGTKFNFTVYQEEASWIAACLDHDVCATGPTVDIAVERLAIAIRAEDAVAKERGLSGWTVIKAAPAGTYAPKEGGSGPKPDPLAPAPRPHYVPGLGMVLNGHLMPPDEEASATVLDILRADIGGNVTKVRNLNELMAVLEPPDGVTPSHSLALSRAMSAPEMQIGYTRR